MNGRFQAKHAKYSSFYTIEIIASITAKFCTMTKTTNSLRGWSKYAPNKSKMVDGLHIAKLPYAPGIVLVNEISEFLKFNMADSHHFENEKSPFPENVE